ncbi:MAG: DUF502 domain-containing protein [Legionella sp.]|nr:DUF502 domain-containing protein [Legionella sp.]
MNSKLIRGYLLAGLVVWLPIFVTIVVIKFLVGLLDVTLSFIPYSFRPENLIGHHIPGLGLLLSLLLLLITGLVATNFLGQRLVRWGESLLSRIPLVRSVYNAAKQVMNAILSTNSEAFRKVVLIEYPRKGAWSLGFQTGSVASEISSKTKEEMISLFIPTTPNPTSGFLVMVPKAEVIELDMSIDEALKFIISLGVMQSHPNEVLMKHSTIY